MSSSDTNPDAMVWWALCTKCQMAREHLFVFTDNRKRPSSRLVTTCMTCGNTSEEKYLKAKGWTKIDA